MQYTIKKNYGKVITRTFNWAFESTLFLSAYLFVYFYLISTWTSNWFLTWISLNYIDDLVLWGGTESLSFISLNVAEADKDGFFLSILHICIMLHSIRVIIYKLFVCFFKFSVEHLPVKESFSAFLISWHRASHTPHCPLSHNSLSSLPHLCT